MNFRRGIEESEGRFQLAPMIDIVFIVLVFFVVISAMEQREKEMEVRPPFARSGTAIERKRFEIIINVKEDGSIVVNRNEWGIQKLRERLQHLSAVGGSDASVMIRADALTAHQNVMSVADACVAAGMERLSFITVEHRKDVPATVNAKALRQ
jgi:biopolymer transport protein ExbD